MEEPDEPSPDVFGVVFEDADPGLELKYDFATKFCHVALRVTLVSAEHRTASPWKRNGEALFQWELGFCLWMGWIPKRCRRKK
jgi:hypothetical protein